MADEEHLAELASWSGKVEDHVRRIARLLAADVVVHARRAAREAFVQDPAADGLDDAAVVALKARLEALAATLAEDVSQQILSHDWGADPGLEPGVDFGALPRVAALQGHLAAALARGLRTLGLAGGAESGTSAWPLPRRFIDGDDLVTLTRGLIKAVGHQRRLRAAVHHQASRQTSSERGRRWDEA